MGMSLKVLQNNLIWTGIWIMLTHIISWVHLLLVWQNLGFPSPCSLTLREFELRTCVGFDIHFWSFNWYPYWSFNRYLFLWYWIGSLDVLHSLWILSKLIPRMSLTPHEFSWSWAEPRPFLSLHLHVYHFINLAFYLVLIILVMYSCIEFVYPEYFLRLFVDENPWGISRSFGEGWTG